MGLAADLFVRDGRWLGKEGPRWHVTVGPGVIVIGSTDRAKQERTAQRESDGARALADVEAAWLIAEGRFPGDPDPSREVTQWSAKSIANMVKSLCMLDYGPMFAEAWRMPAMVTLTYPGEWLSVAPNGRAVKKHLQTFRKRYVRAWGQEPIGVWKLEFQRRGAPHIHIWMCPPHGTARIPERGSRPVGAGMQFRQWLSAVWADVVDHQDPEEREKHLLAGTGVDFAEGLRSTDPMRAAVYFTKHGTFADKSYQHIVPEAWRAPGQGPGRFWGYWTLQKSTKGVEITPEDAVELARLMRAHWRSQGGNREHQAPPCRTARVMRGVNPRTGEIRTRKVRRRLKRMRGTAGFITYNDAPAIASILATFLARKYPGGLDHQAPRPRMSAVVPIRR